MSAPEDNRRALTSCPGVARDAEQGLRPHVDLPRTTLYGGALFSRWRAALCESFPVFLSLMADSWWRKELHTFLTSQRGRRPRLATAGRDYLDYVRSSSRSETPEDPPFMDELLHYEWVEQALQIASNPERCTALLKDPLAGHPELSPLACLLEYRFPVHRVGPDYQPRQPPTEPTRLLVYRSRDRRVSFIALNAFDARVLALIKQRPQCSARQLLAQASEAFPAVDREALRAGGELMLQAFYDLGVLRGARALHK